MASPAGIEPATYPLGGGRAIRCATGTWKTALYQGYPSRPFISTIPFPLAKSQILPRVGVLVPMLVSIVVPVLNEAAFLSDGLSVLQSLRGHNVEIEGVEVIVVDGGSGDNSVEVAKQVADRVIVGSRGRASQMNAGAKEAVGDIVLFMHADTTLPENFTAVLQDWKAQRPQWGFFTVRLSGKGFWLRVIERCMNWRSKLTRVATGDQCLFVERDLFLSVGGFEDIPIMEDVALSKRLRRLFRPHICVQRVTTSSRRWEQYGILRTVMLMWWLRLLYFFGVSPHKLISYYK